MAHLLDPSCLRDEPPIVAALDELEDLMLADPGTPGGRRFDELVRADRGIRGAARRLRSRAHEARDGRQRVTRTRGFRAAAPTSDRHPTRASRKPPTFARSCTRSAAVAPPVPCSRSFHDSTVCVRSMHARAPAPMQRLRRSRPSSRPCRCHITRRLDRTAAPGPLGIRLSATLRSRSHACSSRHPASPSSSRSRACRAISHALVAADTPRALPLRSRTACCAPARTSSAAPFAPIAISTSRVRAPCRRSAGSA